MAYVYSDPAREDDPHALPDIEVFFLGCDEAAAAEIENETDLAHDVASEHGQIFDNVKHMRWFRAAVAKELEDGWYWQACFPGCLPDGDPYGPFATEAEAIADAREYVE